MELGTVRGLFQIDTVTTGPSPLVTEIVPKKSQRQLVMSCQPLSPQSLVPFGSETPGASAPGVESMSQVASWPQSPMAGHVETAER